MSNDTIKRSDAIKALDNAWINGTSLLDANEAVKQLNDLPPADRHSRVYGYLKERLGDIVDSETEFDAWFKRMVWHVEECNRLTDRLQGEAGEDYLRGYNDGYHAREVLDKARVEIHIDKPRGFTLKSISDKQTKEAGRPQGEWIDKGDYAECSNCGADSGIQFDGVESVPRKTNFCPNCGARMDVSEDDRDYERAVEMAEYERLYEPTYNPEDGSM